jgi:hypothetical protein
MMMSSGLEPQALIPIGHVPPGVPVSVASADALAGRVLRPYKPIASVPGATRLFGERTAGAAPAVGLRPVSFPAGPAAAVAAAPPISRVPTPLFLGPTRADMAAGRGYGRGHTVSYPGYVVAPQSAAQGPFSIASIMSEPPAAAVRAGAPPAPAGATQRRGAVARGPSAALTAATARHTAMTVLSGSPGSAVAAAAAALLVASQERPSPSQSPAAQSLNVHLQALSRTSGPLSGAAATPATAAGGAASGNGGAKVGTPGAGAMRPLQSTGRGAPARRNDFSIEALLGQR